MAKDRRKKESKALKMFGWVLISVEVLSMMVLTFTLLRFPILPKKYWTLYAVVCAVVLLISCILLMKQNGIKRYLAGTMFTLLMSAAFVLGFLYAEKSRQTLGNISDHQADQFMVSEMVVMVREDDSAKLVEDVLGDGFGVQKSVDYNNTLAMVEFINEHYKTKISTVVYDDYSLLAGAILNKQVRSIIIEKSYVELMEEYEPDFEESTRILGEFEFMASIPSGDLDSNGNGPTPVGGDKPSKNDRTDITKNYFTVYFSGIDTFGNINVKSRSDVNIVMTVNPKTHKILLVSIPRDAFVTIAGVSGNRYDKLTHAGIHGVKTSMATLENIYGISLDYYVRVNFSSVQKFVDILGGIDVESAYAFTSKHHKYQYTKGINHLDGPRALEFCRERYAFASGDIQRGKNQMEVIKSIINKMMSVTMLSKFPEIMNAIDGNFQTDLSMDQLTSLVRMQLDDAPKWTIDTYTVDTVGAMEYCYSYTGSKLYVGKIVPESLKEASEKMKAVMEGK